MDKTEIGLLMITVILTILNWGMSRIFSRKDNISWLADLRQLWSESKFFLKAQSIMLVLCICGQTYLMMANPEEQIQPKTQLSLMALMARLSQGILPIIKLFYITHLGSKTNPVLVATIGVWTIIQFGIGEFLREFVSVLGLVVFVVPGFIIWFRSSLFMPIYALEGRQVGHAWYRSWELTKGKFWLTSRYLSPILIAFMVSNVLPNLVRESFVRVATHTPGITESVGWHALWYVGVIGSAVSAVAIIALDLMFTGLLYKLYVHLTKIEKSIA